MSKINFVCGFYGSYASGKTTILKLLQKKRPLLKIFFMDEIVAQIYKINQSGYNIIKSNFGINFVSDKEVDREKLRKSIIDNPENLKKLNSCMFPLLKNIIQKLIQNNSTGSIIIECPLLNQHFDEFKSFFDKFIYLKCPDDLHQVLLDNRSKEKNLLDNQNLAQVFNQIGEVYFDFSYTYLLNNKNTIVEKIIQDLKL